MIFDGPVPVENQKRSQRNYMLFLVFNGFAYMCLGETVILLIAIKLGSPDAVVSALGAMVFFSFILLPLGKIVSAKVGAARSQSFFWVARNCAGLLVAMAVPVSLYVNGILAEIMLLAGGFFFYGFRAAGVVLSQPLLGGITSPSERASFLSKSNSISAATSCMALVAVAVTCQLTESVWALMAIAICGSCMGATSSRFILGIDESGVLRESAKKPLVGEIRMALSEEVVRKQVAGVFCTNLAIILLTPTSLITVKRGFCVSDGNAVIFSIVQWLSSIGGSWVASKLTRKLGPRRVAILSYLLILAIVPLWIFLTSFAGHAPRLLLFLPFVLAGFCFFAMNNSMTHYFLQTVEEQKRVAVSLLIYTASGMGAGLTALCITSTAFCILERYYGIPSPETYRIYFIIAGILLLPGLMILSSLRPLPVEKRMHKGAFFKFLW
ncbi:MAG: hypothetical protein IKA79_05430 [Lentisphaeria bacterium]|nr:hypothetical protein [Lentisphaeria bacterium]